MGEGDGVAFLQLLRQQLLALRTPCSLFMLVSGVDCPAGDNCTRLQRRRIAKCSAVNNAWRREQQLPRGWSQASPCCGASGGAQSMFFILCEALPNFIEALRDLMRAFQNCADRRLIRSGSKFHSASHGDWMRTTADRATCGLVFVPFYHTHADMSHRIHILMSYLYAPIEISAR